MTDLIEQIARIFASSTPNFDFRQDLDAWRGPSVHREYLHRAEEAYKLAMTRTQEQDDAVFAAFLGISVLATMCRAAKLSLAQKRAEELLVELDAAFPGLVGRSALRAQERVTPS